MEITGAGPSWGTTSDTASDCRRGRMVPGEAALFTPVAGRPGTLTSPQASPLDGLLTASSTCPNCGTVLNSEASFCEGCGLNLATGQLPSRVSRAEPADLGAKPPAVEPCQWTAVIQADRQWFERNQAKNPKAVTFPDGHAPWEVPLAGDEVVIGRRSDAKGVMPDIDLSSPVPDPAVTRRHAVLRRQLDGSWALTDEGSTNGTWLNKGVSQVEPGTLVPLQDGDRVNLGAFSAIVMRHNEGAAK